VKTRYSGEFIQAIDGIEGGGNRDWFIYVNGYALDRSAADYLLRPGDVEWWDYRRWSDPGEAPLVAGAFPEPFLHGFDGKRRPAVVRYTRAGLRAGAVALARVIGAGSVAPAGNAVPREANVLLLTWGAPQFRLRYRAGHGSAGDPVEFIVAGAAPALARDPHRYARVYSVP
jgi:hypothetical protein